MEMFLITIQQLNANVLLEEQIKSYHWSPWTVLGFLDVGGGCLFLAHGWSKLSCLLVGISDGACGVSSMRWQWQYTVVHLALKVYLETLIFCFGNDVASEELKGKNAQIVISRDPKTIMELMKIRWLTNVTLSLYQFADLIYLNAKGFREILFQGVNLLTKANTKFDID